VTSRIENRSLAESWISSLAMHLTQFATALPEVSVNAGPERQIDFTTRPALPTRSPLWTILAQDVRTGKDVRPAYWRMFTLAKYDGKSWFQAEFPSARALQEMLPANTGLVRPLPLPPDNGPSALDSLHRTKGFDIARGLLNKGYLPPAFGAPTRLVRVRVTSRQANLGFVPHLPTIRYMALPQANPEFLTSFPDQSVDARYVEPNQVISLVCSVPPGEDYGLPGEEPPLKANQRPIPQARLSAGERHVYLQLPDHNLDRVKALARRMVAGLPADASDYARAVRLSDALRRHATYTLRPPPAPEDRDATDFFLFESRRGYCTHFASALTVLCRSIGIPARIAEGFTTGERMESNGSFLVRESNAHAWTEAWIEGWGWTTLDAVPSDDRGDNAGDWWVRWADALSGVFENVQLWWSRHLLLICLGLASLCLVTLGFYHERAALPARRLASLRFSRRAITDKTARRTIDEVYERAAHGLQKRFRARTTWETPHEWLHAAETALHFKQTAPLKRLTDLYVQAQYSPRELGAGETEDAWRALHDLSWEVEK
jgi:hypothetical protein